MDELSRSSFGNTTVVNCYTRPHIESCLQTLPEDNVSAMNVPLFEGLEVEPVPDDSIASIESVVPINYVMLNLTGNHESRKVDPSNTIDIQLETRNFAFAAEALGSSHNVAQESSNLKISSYFESKQVNPNETFVVQDDTHIENFTAVVALASFLNSAQDCSLMDTVSNLAPRRCVPNETFTIEVDNICDTQLSLDQTQPYDFVSGTTVVSTSYDNGLQQNFVFDESNHDPGTSAIPNEQDAESVNQDGEQMLSSESEILSPPAKKLKRNRSHAFRIGRAAEKHPFQSHPCSCKKSCDKNLSITSRKSIHAQFWQLTYNERRNFLFNRVLRKPKERTRTDNDEAVRTVSFTYTLMNPSNSDVIQVCKPFFLTTLGYHPKNDSIITSLMKSTPRDAIVAGTDRRGSHPPAKISDWHSIESHIMTYNPQISHYRRAHAPLRKYLPSDISIRSMHDDFISKFQNKCSYQTYRKQVHKLNISFTKLGEEMCEQCEEYHQGHGQNKCLSSGITNEDCITCAEWHKHINLANQTRKMYRLDADREWPEDYSVRSVDLQKVIMLPRMPGIKSVVFTKRIVAFHETFALIGKDKKKTPDKKHISVLWHEGIAGRKAEELAAAFVKAALNEQGCKHFVYWLDMCCSK
jgi:hypothetical protein